MQQQAILVICQKLKIEEHIDDVKNIEIVAYRNDFSAHSSNRGRGKSEHSYILDRHAMRKAKIKGYTANHETGSVFKDANINNLITNWNVVLERQLGLIATKLSSS